MRRNIENMFNISSFNNCKMVFMFDDTNIIYANYDVNGYKIIYDEGTNKNIIYTNDLVSIEDFYECIINSIKKNVDTLNTNITFVNAKYKDKDDVISVKYSDDKVYYELKNDNKKVKETEDASGFMLESYELIEDELIYISQVNNEIHTTNYKLDKNYTNLDDVDYSKLEPTSESVFEENKEIVK